MKTVSFYIPNKKIKDVNLSTVHLCNPGIGGTEYTMFALCHYLSLFNDINLTVYTNCSLKGYNLRGNIVYVDNLQDALLDSKEKNIDIFVLHHSEHSMGRNTFSVLDGSQISVVIWIHNFLKPKYLTYYNECFQIKRLVFVGKRFMEVYKDHIAYNKSVYIYNGIYIDDTIEIPSFSERNNNVTYIGNLIYGKGFHVLAKAWKKVLKEVPDAHLHVIGSAKLYDRTSKLGKFGYAEKGYERKFMKYLTDKNGIQLPSVIFHGIMGKEKNEILKQTKVGVPNPTGVSETFGYTAVEMEMFGCLITTIRCPGYIDTVSSTGILYKSVRNLSESIITLLKRNDNNFDDTIRFVHSRFDFNIISKQWNNLFDDILSSSEYKIVCKPQNTSALDQVRMFKSRHKIFRRFPTIYGVRMMLNNLISIKFYIGLIKKLR